VVPLTKLRELRQRAFLSQEALAKKSGVAEATINRLEQGAQLARYVTARKLAEALGVPPDALTTDERTSE
jgi:transcriptional regulator with XRE-family HTH domain